MAERDWEVRLGLRLDSLENADPVARARIHQGKWPSPMTRGARIRPYDDRVIEGRRRKAL